MPSLALAEQLAFSKIEKGDNYQFNYQWLDYQGEAQSLQFSLAKQAIFDRFRNFKVFKAEMAKYSINNALQKKLRAEPIRGVMINFSKNSNEDEIVIKGRNNQAINAAYAKIHQLKQTLSDEYLAENYYHQFITHDQINAVKPDHGRFANIASIDLKSIKPMILKKFSIKNIRKVTDYVLGFVQSIPYATLESRVTASGAGFNPPLKLLWENQGDCDSKVTLTVAILRSLMPRIKMTLVFIDNHALLGIQLPAQADDQTVVVDGISYVLAEPTGPRLLPLGKIAPASELAVGNGHYTAELFHTKVKRLLKTDLKK
ncbi:hypothetical protein [Colwellia hornerae]|uniref:Transglutaminase domain-containing protein n=2 Tax=Colwellia hornerae TaxID=89402 RepID=A0A5C6Q938_9GAMM|nr:hypothetical protein [Colwellia hornerae]TWX53063.1 hypothetical protein ESZ28_10810 [Colwellia hornerae]TWX59326.1 hypothetical protein ESZ26_10190 [Colwellia hornerae]TWX65486.1 hypothetical protein ESZ27_12280 [Colwellia hornerae]